MKVTPLTTALCFAGSLFITPIAAAEANTPVCNDSDHACRVLIYTNMAGSQVDSTPCSENGQCAADDNADGINNTWPSFILTHGNSEYKINIHQLITQATLAQRHMLPSDVPEHLYRPNLYVQINHPAQSHCHAVPGFSPIEITYQGAQICVNGIGAH